MLQGIGVEYVAADRIAALPARLALAGRAAIGLAVFGASPREVAAALPRELAALACATVALPVLTQESAWVEVWSVPQRDCAIETRETPGGIRYAASGEVLFATIEIDQARHVAALQSATADAYDALFTLLAEQGFPHPLRFWNYLPDITLETHPIADASNESERAIERYRSFNAGRQDAFLVHRRSIVDGAPAACALGTARGAATIYVLAGKSPPIAIENPRQVSAYRYPEQYGKRSPTFSRAALAQLGTAQTLFISGTASIVGHETMHRGDVAAQTEETLDNIDALLGEVAHIASSRPAADALRLKVYIRHAAHLDSVRAIVARRLGDHVHAVYLRADVCRSDLLVEIEAAATLGSQEGQA